MHIYSPSLQALSLRMALVLTLLIPAAAFAQSPMQAKQSDSFVDSIGVGTDITYCGLYQTNWSGTSQNPGILQLLQNLAIRHIRDGYFDSSSGPNCPNNTGYGSQWVTEHQQLSQSGIDTNYVIPYNTSVNTSDIESLSSQVHDMDSLEAPNECDNAYACGGNGSIPDTQGVNNMLGFLPNPIDQAGGALGIPVVGPSFMNWDVSEYGNVGNLSGEMTYNNLHVYLDGLNPGFNSPGVGGGDSNNNYWPGFPYMIDLAQNDGPNVPIRVTETGYPEVAPPDNQTCTIPTDLGAAYISRTLLTSFQAGVARTYLFQLLTDPSWDQPGGDFGLVNSDLTPKPAYYAVQNLIANFWDPGPPFNPGQLSVSITVPSGDPTPQAVLLQKHDGSFWLILWIEHKDWNPDAENNCQYVGNGPGYTLLPAQDVTVTVPSSYQIPNVGLMNNTGTINWSSYDGPSSVTWPNLSGQVSIFKILSNN